MKLTVCTPTYNRAHTLKLVFDSLIAQTVQDFEWIIIDDGSTDDTRTLVTSFKAITTFPIHYRFQRNQGKHVAVNHGAKLTNGDFFIIADSDDSFPSDAFEILLDAWNDIPLPQRPEFTGVTGLCVTDQGAVIGDCFPFDVFDTTSAELFYRWRIRGEKWGFHRSSVIRQHPFPEIPGVPFVRESIIWHAISKQYKTRFVNKPVRTYRQNSGEQLTKQSPQQRSHETLFYAMSLNADHGYLLTAPWTFCKMATQGVRFALHHSCTMREQYARLEQPMIKVLWTAAIIPGLLLYFIDLCLIRVSR